MAPRGRPPKPVELHVLHGSFRADRHGDVPPAAETPEKAPPRPKSLTGDARKFWDDFVPGLVERGVAKLCDGPELAALCEWWKRYRKCATALDKIAPTHHDAQRLLQMTAQAWKAFDAIASKFGLTPVDRARIKERGAPKSSGVRTRQRSG